MDAHYDSRLEPDDMIATIKPGMIVGYRLLPSELPRDPTKTWRGKVIRCEAWDTCTILVEVLEDGYHGLIEHINCRQIVGFDCVT
jgi:hypothetical protein